MKRVVGLMALLIAVLTVTPAAADFYVIAGGGRLGTAITTVPIAITSPGLYYLSNNLTSSVTTNNAITVNADDVTIDLMGFCLTGPGKESGEGNSGIRVAATRTNVEIRNGSIKAFGFDGIQAGDDCTGIRVVALRVRETGHNGINLKGDANLVMDCAVMNVGSDGITFGLGGGSMVKGCHVQSCKDMGIYLGLEATAVGNTVRLCRRGILGGRFVADNTVGFSGEIGIAVGMGNTITRNTAYINTGTGINTGDYCTITNNTTDGLKSEPTCTLADNTVTP